MNDEEQAQLLEMPDAPAVLACPECGRQVNVHLLMARVVELEASERELQAERDAWEARYLELVNANPPLDVLREQVAELQATVAVLFERLNIVLSRSRANDGSLLADLPTAAREHLARDADVEAEVAELQHDLAESDEACVATREHASRLFEELQDAKARDAEREKALTDCAETLIWASGAFASYEQSQAWAKHGRPVLNRALDLLGEPARRHAQEQEPPDA